MKAKNLLLLIVFFVASVSAAFAQKEKLEIDYDKKTDIVTINGIAVFKITKDARASGITYTVQSLEGNTLIIFSPVYYKDSREITQSNPTGSQSYHDIIFLDDKDLKADYEWRGMKQTAKMLYENKLIVNGKLDMEAAKLFVRMQGTVNYEKRMTAR